jgi:glutamate/aspartate transport system permease protein
MCSSPAGVIGGCQEFGDMHELLGVDVIFNNAGFLLAGLRLSFLLTLVGVCGGIVCGTLLSLARLFEPTLLGRAVKAYVYLFRAIPLVLVIFWIYFILPLVMGRPVGALVSVVVSFSLFEAAYYSEIIRSGIASVRAGQFNAGLAMGMSKLQCMVYIVLPQAFRAMIPVFLTQAIILFQDTSLVFVVSLHDFMTASSVVADRDGNVVTVYVFACLVYYLISAGLSLIVGHLGKESIRD